MKMRETLRSSSTSSHREITPENHSTRNIGCISGIFQLISKYQHRRKFLTSSDADSEKERKSIRTSSSSSSSSSPSRKPKSAPVEVEKTPIDSEFKRFSLDELRSPTIPSKIRLSSNSDDSSSYSPKKLPSPRSPALVARLMGLDEIPVSSPSPAVSSSVEKRRKLMEALEKCDEDLKVLKTIIEAIKSTDSKIEVVQKPEESELHKCEAVARDDRDRNHRCLIDEFNSRDSMRKSDINCSDDQPSPVSVLDQISDSPPSPSDFRRSTTAHHHQIGEKYKKSREESGSNSLTNFNRVTFDALPIRNNSGHKRSSDINYQCEYFISTGVNNNKQSSTEAAKFEFQSSKSKVECVSEVCLDAVWAERWELGRIGAVLEDYIFQRLIEEIVAELGCVYISSTSSIRFEKCRKKLSF